MERLLHYIWKHKIFPLKQLETTTGMRVEVIDAGLLNSDAGPDFFNAKVKINETLWIGNIEIHTKASDWFRHGHNKDKVYDSVILHVAEDIDCEISRTNGEQIPQMQLSCPISIEKNYETLHRADMLPLVMILFQKCLSLPFIPGFLFCRVNGLSIRQKLLAPA
jgi:Protein of unknown function (DUF2851).